MNRELHPKLVLRRTGSETLDRRRQPFPISDLPTTVRDALHIIHAIGIRYAWVDTLCIVQDEPKDVATMHKVYSNALFTLCSCATTHATTHATTKLLDQREAWTQRTEPCRLGGQWLMTSDMSLNELRLRSPLAERAWTLQEERLSPRMLYVSSNRVYWSCAKGQEMELKPICRQKATPTQRPVYAASDHDTQMPLAQEFLLACYSGTSDLHPYWADIVKSYALRDMTNLSDRLTALSGLAAKYLSASRLDEYLAGLWANNMAEGLGWRVKQSVKIVSNRVDPVVVSPPWPSWSWAVLPLQTEIEMTDKSARSSFFQRVEDGRNENSGARSSAEDAVKRGEHVKEICVFGRMRTLWKPSSRSTDWSAVSVLVDGEERFSFAINPEQNMHTLEPESGRILVYEDRKRGVVSQVDFQRDVGVAWDVREDYFASAQCRALILL
ncbi:HET-domain-containing protein [Cucurbitaria berberidis CBS 394.84]|uniref:HET-domain-containing protein n=1 Tax=Cucurbitaria berberidis CBS 394.84 TaxID=1168544 RepID=A0A9P4L3T0_9PLEO|nr:HET-domain-containing protein [Cucurbitaria berberidis CBS 394.84]KAF1840634.1 HET-domain-containing protein [Cucurbitaria berberidis CBS 394.84]